MSHDFVCVRNDNNSITYVGDWSIVHASTVNSLVHLINGPPFSPTLHETTTTGSFIFPFHGSSINVVGTKNLVNISDSVEDPSWTCVVDGTVIPNSLSGNQQNIQPMCSQTGLTDGAHELVVNVTSQGTPFYLDFFEYTPTPDISLENSFLLIANTDPRVDFISGWKSVGIRQGTTNTDSLVNVTFIGTQLAWYGDIPFSEPQTNASSGKFSVDGQSFTPFKIPQSFSTASHNQLIFTTPMLEMGSHVLSAKYTGSPGQSPFTFEYLIVTNGSFSSTGLTPISSTPTNPPPTNFTPTNSSPTNVIGGTGRTPTSPPSPLNHDAKSSSHIGSIVGGVVGGVVGIVASIVVLLFWLRSRGRNGGSVLSTTEPYSPLSNQATGSQGTSSANQSRMSSLSNSTSSLSSNPVSFHTTSFETSSE